MTKNTIQHKDSFGRMAAITAACFTIQAVGIGCFVTFGVFFNSLLEEFNWSRAALSGASSLAFFLMGVFGIAVGRLNDRYGPRKLMQISAIFLGSGLVLMTQLQELWQLYIFYGLIFGIGLSSIDVIALTTIARWFNRRRGLITGIVKVGTGTGQLIFPLLATALIASFSWRHAYLLLGLIAAGVLFATSFILRRNPAACTGPESGSEKRSPVTNPSSEVLLSAGSALKTVQLWMLAAINFLLVFCLLIVLVHIVPHAHDLGLPAAQAAGVISVIGGVSMTGRFISGIVIDKMGGKPVFLCCFFFLITALIWLRFADSLWALYLFAGIYGLAHGGFFTAISPLVAEIFGIDSHGTIFGIIVCFGTTGGAIGPVAAGYFFDLNGSYFPVFSLITAMSLVAACLTLLLNPPHRRTF